jgi:MFS family permease
MSFIGIIIPSQTFLQEATPGGLRGRVFGNFWFLVTVATILPIIFSGAIVEIFGIRFLCLLLTSFGLIALIVSKKFGQKMLVNSFNISKNA